MVYDKGLKEAILEKVLPPNNGSSVKLAEETGVSYWTIRRWKREALKDQGNFVVEKESFTSHDKFAMTFGHVCS